MTKKVYQFHLDMVAKHEKELETTGTTKVLSAFLFHLLKPLLKDTDQIEKVLSDSYKTFCWSGDRRYSSTISYTPSIVLSFIDKKRISREEALQIFDDQETDHYTTICLYDDKSQRFQGNYKYTITRQDVEDLFNEKLPKTHRLECALIMSDKCHKFGLLTLFPVRKYNYVIRR